MTALALLLALIVLIIAPWAQIPAPAYRLLPLSVGAPELSPWLLVIALLASVLATIGLRRRQRGRRLLARAAVALSVIATALPAYVLVQIPGSLREIDADWQRAFGKPAAESRTVDARSSMRPARLTWREMFTGLDLPAVRITRDVLVRNADGVRLTVDIYRPDHEGVVPTVVQIYGGGWRGGEPKDNAEIAHAMAAAGFAVFAIDYRHAPDWTWPTQLEDVLDALRWVTSHAAEYGSDPARLALVGRSAGAQLAMRASQDIAAPPIRAVVTIYGPVDLTEGHRVPPSPDPLDVRMIEEQFLGGTPDEHPDRYADASPITRAANPHPPVLVITGGRDHIVLPRFGRLLHERLLESGVSVRLHMPWADHGFDFVPFGPSSQIALYYTQRFLAEALR